jgi:hypothetical protein
MELFVMPRLRRGVGVALPAAAVRDRVAQHVDDAFRTMLDPDRLDALAEDLRVIERRCVHHAGLAVCAWVLSAFERGTDTEGRQLDARRTYEQLGGPVASKSSFRDLSLKLRPVFQTLLRRATRRWVARSPAALRGRLASFADVLIPDGCAFKLANALTGVYAGTGQAAEFKLHALYSVRHGITPRVACSAGAVHDTEGLPTGDWQPGALYIWDLAFNDYGRFLDAAQAGAIPLQRLKDTANPVVVASYGPTGTRRAIQAPDGRPLRLDDACAFGVVHHRDVLDLDVELRAPGHRPRVARVVCVPCDGEPRWYLTMLPRAIFTAHDVAEIYRIRWECELYFRHWKGAVRLDEVRRLRDPAALEVAVLASLLASLLSHEIHDAVERCAQTAPAALERPAQAPAAFPP